jgi:hypothetical protein
MGFNRNIIIQADVDRYLDPGKRNPKTLTANPPGGFVPALAPAQAAQVGAAPAGAAPEGGAAVASGGAAVASGGAAVASGGAAVATSAAATAPGGVAVPSEDDYLTKVVKYIPPEVLAAYLFMAGVIDSNVTGRHDHAIWLGGLLIGILVLTIPYDLRVLKIVRWSQIAMSVLGIAVYVFAVGGWFATTTWYHQWYASIVVPVFGLVIAILKLPPLPEDPNAPQPAAAKG